MKPPPFAYHAAGTARETVALLDELGDQARVLAGGQSLIPLMNFRLAQPAHLVDINPVTELDFIRVADGGLAIGARTRQAALERSGEAAQRAPLLVEAAALVGHPPIRHRGTVGGSIAHADPAAELPAALAAMDGEVVVASKRRQRTLSALDFFTGPFSTALGSGELLTEIRVRPWPARTGHAFVEFSRTHGNFAVVGAAVLLHLDANRIDRAAIVLCGVAGVPKRASRAEQRLVGSAATSEVVAEAAEIAAADLQPPSDVHGTAEYRRKLARVYVQRALTLALSRARGGH